MQALTALHRYIVQLPKGKGYVLITPPDLFGPSLSIGCCLALVLVVMAVKGLAR